MSSPSHFTQRPNSDQRGRIAVAAGPITPQRLVEELRFVPCRARIGYVPHSLWINEAGGVLRRALAPFGTQAEWCSVGKCPCSLPLPYRPLFRRAICSIRVVWGLKKAKVLHGLIVVRLGALELILSQSARIAPRRLEARIF